jgi:hypothetical protein
MTAPAIRDAWIKAVESGMFNDPVERVAMRFAKLMGAPVEWQRNRPTLESMAQEARLEQDPELDDRIPAEVIKAEQTVSRWFEERNIKQWKLGGSQRRID